MDKARIAVLVSGSGTNLQALINAENKNILISGSIKLVISNNAIAFALKRAEKAGIPTKIITKKDSKNREEFEQKIINELFTARIDLIILAGFMCILSEKFTKTFENKIINVHPSLIPSFCGKGFYGIKVHEEALARGVKVTGATVHFVNEIPDGGKIILQKAVNIKQDDTASTLQKRVMQQAEWKILPMAAELVSQQIVSKKG